MLKVTLKAVGMGLLAISTTIALYSLRGAIFAQEEDRISHLASMVIFGIAPVVYLARKWIRRKHTNSLGE